MKRLHVHISVPDLEQAIHYYSQMFGEQPSKMKQDYAKWQLDEPSINFAISTRSEKIGLDHLGLQVDDEDELKQLNTRLLAAEIDAGEMSNSTCCYAESVKSWSFDPAGIPWESFVTMQDAEVFGTDMMQADGSACCSGDAPKQSKADSCCAKPEDSKPDYMPPCC